MDLVRRDIYVKIRKKIYKFATIAIDTGKVEMFYHFPWGGKYKAEQVINGIIEDSHLPDHISFHTDGAVHFKYKHRNKKQKSGYYKDQHFFVNPFNVPRNEAYLLLIESVKKMQLRLKTSLELKSDSIVFDLGRNQEFSFLMFAISTKFNPKYLIEGEFRHLTTISQGIIWSSAFSLLDKMKLPQKSRCQFDTNLVMLFVKNVVPDTPSIQFSDGSEHQLSIYIAPPPKEVIRILPFIDPTLTNRKPSTFELKIGKFINILREFCCAK